MTIRTRLVLLVLAIFVPTAMSAAWLVLRTYEGERQATNRAMRDTARALAQAVDREIAQREVIARALAGSLALDDLPSVSEAQRRRFHREADAAMNGLRGWVVVHDERGSHLMNTALPVGAPMPPLVGGLPVGFRFATEKPLVTDLRVGRVTGRPIATVQMPLTARNGTRFNISVAILPEEMIDILRAQALPDGWVAAVATPGHKLMARLPDPDKWVGKPITTDLQEAVSAAAEGFKESRTLEGRESMAFFSRSPRYGWTVVLGFPRDQMLRNVQASLTQLAVGAVAMLTVSLILAMWLSRLITGPIERLRRNASALEAGEPILVHATGIQECDEVNSALATASTRIRRASTELEDRVQKAVEQARDAQEKLARGQRLEALGRLTGGVAHDVNNLLAVINNNLYLLERHPDAGQQGERLAAIRRAVDNGAQLTRRLLTFSRQSAMQPEVLPLQSRLEDTAMMIRSVVGRQIEVSFVPQADAAPVRVDVSELEVALVNLAANARDAMPHGGKLQIRVRDAAPDERPDPAQPFVAVEVKDSGSGIPPELIEQVFEPFFTTKSVGKGYGLGLAQVKAFCEQSGGVARIGSRMGQGTTVSLLLPAASADEIVPVAVPDESRPQAVSAARLLLVEDNEELADATRHLLEALGYEVTYVQDGESALEVLGNLENHFDLVLSDVVMPGAVDGVALARLLHTRSKAPPIVLITGYTDQFEQAVQEGFTVLRKPVSPQLLAQTIPQLIKKA